MAKGVDKDLMYKFSHAESIVFDNDNNVLPIETPQKDVERLDESNMWCGELACILVSRALGVTVKMVSPKDMAQRASTEYILESGETPPGTGRSGVEYLGNLLSQTFVCIEARDTVVKEVVVALVPFVRDSVGRLADIPVIVPEMVEKLDTNHFAAIVGVQENTASFPMNEAAPARYPENDQDRKRQSDNEQEAWRRRRTAAAASPKDEMEGEPRKK